MPVFDFPVESVIRALDGDTCQLRIDLGFGVKYDVDVRLEGIDTPEMRGASKAAAIVARDKLNGWLLANRLKLRLFSKKWDKYGGRTLGSVYVVGQRNNTATANQLAERVAKPYDGSKKVEWLPAELKKIEALGA